MKSYWVSNARMTVTVDTTDNGVITVAPPIARKFVGQPVGNLISWMKRMGPTDVKATVKP